MCKSFITYWSCGHKYDEQYADCDEQKASINDLGHGPEVADCWVIDASCFLCREPCRRRTSIEQFYDDKDRWYGINKRVSSSDPTVLSIEKVPGHPESRENVQKLSDEVCNEEITISSYGYPHNPDSVSCQNRSKAELLRDCEDTIHKLEEFGRTLEKLLGRIEDEQNPSVPVDARDGTDDSYREPESRKDLLHRCEQRLRELHDFDSSFGDLDSQPTSPPGGLAAIFAQLRRRPRSTLGKVEDVFECIESERRCCTFDDIRTYTAVAERKHESITELLRLCTLRVRELRYVRSLIDDEWLKPREPRIFGMPATDLIACLEAFKSLSTHKE